MEKKNNWEKIAILAAVAVVIGAVASVTFQIVKSGQRSGKPENVMQAPVMDELSEDDNKGEMPTAVNVVKKDPASLHVDTSDVSDIVDCVMPAVVSINCTRVTTGYNFFGMEQKYQQSVCGTGFFAAQSPDRLFIATNNHVVEGATSITVTMNDGNTASAEIVGTDSDYDLAVIAIYFRDVKSSTLDEIRIATLGSSDSLETGAMAIAIGNALGYGQSTTVGYISALDRYADEEENKMPLIQTDAAINPGNSGGPLLNAYGEVIGINSEKLAATQVEGMCYAIPISKAVPIINDLIGYEELDESEIGYLGIQGQDVNQTYATGFSMPMGIYISFIEEDSPAAGTELRVGDIITAVNGREVSTMTELKNRFTHIRAGAQITITVMRNEGGRYKERHFDVTLGHRPE